MPDATDRRDILSRWLQRTDEELLYTPSDVSPRALVTVRPAPGESDAQAQCRTRGWLCPCHPPTVAHAEQPTERCPFCEHPALARSQMPTWWALWRAAPPEV
ncbi:MAG: hypothetical protein AB7N91_15380 [Candidatus Tectimicrobiota bacterium]